MWSQVGRSKCFSFFAIMFRYSCRLRARLVRGRSAEGKGRLQIFHHRTRLVALPSRNLRSSFIHGKTTSLHFRWESWSSLGKKFQMTIFSSFNHLSSLQLLSTPTPTLPPPPSANPNTNVARMKKKSKAFFFGSVVGTSGIKKEG